MSIEEKEGGEIRALTVYWLRGVAYHSISIRGAKEGGQNEVPKNIPITAYSALYHI